MDEATMMGFKETAVYYMRLKLYKLGLVHVQYDYDDLVLLPREDKHRVVTGRHQLSSRYSDIMLGSFSDICNIALSEVRNGSWAAFGAADMWLLPAPRVGIACDTFAYIELLTKGGLDRIELTQAVEKVRIQG